MTASFSFAQALRCWFELGFVNRMLISGPGAQLMS
jgi:hypothetical protein